MFEHFPGEVAKNILEFTYDTMPKQRDALKKWSSSCRALQCFVTRINMEFRLQQNDMLFLEASLLQRALDDIPEFRPVVEALIAEPLTAVKFLPKAHRAHWVAIIKIALRRKDDEFCMVPWKAMQAFITQPWANPAHLASRMVMSQKIHLQMACQLRCTCRSTRATCCRFPGAWEQVHTEFWMTLQGHCDARPRCTLYMAEVVIQTGMMPSALPAYIDQLLPSPRPFRVKWAQWTCPGTTSDGEWKISTRAGCIRVRGKGVWPLLGVNHLVVEATQEHVLWQARDWLQEIRIQMLPAQQQWYTGAQRLQEATWRNIVSYNEHSTTGDYGTEVGTACGKEHSIGSQLNTMAGRLYDMLRVPTTKNTKGNSHLIAGYLLAQILLWEFLIHSTEDDLEAGTRDGISNLGRLIRATWAQVRSASEAHLRAKLISHTLLVQEFGAKYMEQYPPPPTIEYWQTRYRAMTITRAPLGQACSWLTTMIPKSAHSIRVHAMQHLKLRLMPPQLTEIGASSILVHCVGERDSTRQHHRFSSSLLQYLRTQKGYCGHCALILPASDMVFYDTYFRHRDNNLYVLIGCACSKDGSSSLPSTAMIG